MGCEYEFIKHIEGVPFKILFTSISRRLHHWHNDLEVLLVIDGSVSISTSRNKYILKKDDLFIINRNEIHSLTGTLGRNTVIAIQIDPLFCINYYPKLQRVKFLNRHIEKSLDPERWEKVSKCMTEMVMLYFKKEDGYQFKLMSTLNMLIYYLIKCMPSEYINEEKMFAEEKSLERLNRIINYIKKNYKYKISLRELANNEKLDMYYLSHFIKDKLGIPFQEYLNKVRLERAVELIQQTEMNNLNICVESGFSDYRYLNKMFRKEFGCTPSQYKSQYKNIEPVKVVSDENEQNIIFDESESFKKFKEYLNK